MIFKLFLISFLFAKIQASAIPEKDLEEPFIPIDQGVGSSSNPSPANHIGTGYLFEKLGLKKETTGLSIEGFWIFDGDQLLSGGIPHEKKSTLNNLVQLEMTFDTGKVSSWKGGLFAVEFLQLNTSSINSNAGLVQGFEGLSSTEPFNRTELYQWWYRQEFLNGKIITRIGKSTPNYDFNAVLNLFPMNDYRISPVASGLIYGTIFTQGSLTSFLPSYYNSAFGASVFYFPKDNFYISLGAYDGNKARGEPTGIQGPHFNGYYFFISETGYSWAKAHLPGRIALGVWDQTGKLILEKPEKVISQQGTQGLYFFGSQRLWWTNKDLANSGLVTFLQIGVNNTKTLQINKFLGWGLTAYGLVPKRIKDSFGLGVSLAELNKNSTPHSNELVFQTYYQCCLYGTLYLEPVVSYIPKPGAVENLPGTWAATLRMLARF